MTAQNGLPQGAFIPGSFSPPINYGIQSPAVGRGGPNMAANSYAQHFNPWVPIWNSAVAVQPLPYPYGAASSLNTIPQNPNLWTAYMLPTGTVVKLPSTVSSF